MNIMEEVKYMAERAGLDDFYDYPQKVVKSHQNTTRYYLNPEEKYIRQTGRSTRIALEFLVMQEKNSFGEVAIVAHNPGSCQAMQRKIKALADKAGVNLPNKFYLWSKENKINAQTGSRRPEYLIIDHPLP